MNVSLDLTAYLKRNREEVDQALDQWLPSEKHFPGTLYRAMRYSLFAGGKRVRPILALAACDTLDGDRGDVLPAACALELIHTYSLIHDDLPAMDNDDLRRGKATNHKVFGEAMAILAGDALLTHAFQLLTEIEVPSLPERDRLRIVGEIASAAGAAGMIGGQVVDLLCAGDGEVDQPTLEFMHTHKTGAMIRASLRVGAIAGGADDRFLRFLTRYGERVGLAFQIIDDILDLEGEEAVIGKQVGSDLKNGKATYPALYGVAESRRRADELIDAAVADLAEFNGRAEPLRAIAGYIVERIH
ncbi:MAG: polyprenyl synthetase family protein [Deltaproteobacteria bacterium]|nr:polyprenyl synthetase family protein [Deltaproteobacteria bacterium]